MLKYLEKISLSQQKRFSNWLNSGFLTLFKITEEFKELLFVWVKACQYLLNWKIKNFLNFKDFLLTH